MKLESVTLHNLGPYSHATLDLSKVQGRIVALAAANGSGKTVLLECAIPGACWRSTPTRGSLADLATDRDAYLEATLVNGERFTVRHQIDAASGKGETVATDANGAPLYGSTKVRDWDAWAKSHLPAQEVVLASMFAPQGSGGFLDMSAGDRKRVLLRTLGIERYEAMAERAREQARESSGRLATLLARVEDEKARGGDLDAAQRHLEASQASASKSEAEAVKNRADLTTLESQASDLRAEIARLEAERTAAGDAATELERQAADAHARREAALTAQDATKGALQFRLHEARAKVEKTEQLIANNRRVLDDAEAIKAVVARAAEIDEQVADCRVKAGETQGEANRWKTTESHERATADAAAKRGRVALDRESNARKRLADRALVESAIAALPSFRTALDGAKAALDYASAARESARAARLVSAEWRIVALRTALGTIAGMGHLCESEDAPAVAGAAIATDDAAVAEAKDAPARLKAAEAAESETHKVFTKASNDLAQAERSASLAPTIAAAESDLEAATKDALAAGSEEQTAGLEADAARQKFVELRGVVSSVEAKIQAMTAERAALSAKLRLAEPLATAEARIQELGGMLFDLNSAVVDIETEIAALPLEPPDAVKAGEDAACFLERARGLRADSGVFLKDTIARLFTVDRAQIEKRRATVSSEESAKWEAANVASARLRVETAQASAEKIATLAAERATIEADLADWTLLAESLGAKGIQALEIDAAGPELTAMVNDLLTRAFGPRWSVSIETTRSSSDGKKEVETCDVMVIDSERGREAAAESLSGGERVIVGEAISLALSMLAIRRSGMTGVTLIRDETGAALDAANGRAWIEMLRRAADIVGASHLIYVSHSPEVQDLADAKIVVENGTVRIE